MSELRTVDSKGRVSLGLPPGQKVKIEKFEGDFVSVRKYSGLLEPEDGTLEEFWEREVRPNDEIFDRVQELFREYNLDGDFIKVGPETTWNSYFRFIVDSEGNRVFATGGNPYSAMIQGPYPWPTGFIQELLYIVKADTDRKEMRNND